ncbi:MAG: hypothetical protein AAGD00_05805 [Planctomycetota bacterium]
MRYRTAAAKDAPRAEWHGMRTREDTSLGSGARVASDAELASLAESSRGWELAEACALRLAEESQDETATVFLALAGCLIRCPELAMHAIEGVESPDAEEIRAIAGTLPTTRMMPGAIVANCRANLDALGNGSRNGLESDFEAWASDVREARRAFFRTDRGNVIVRRGNTLDSWDWLRDERGLANAVNLGFEAVTDRSSVNDCPGVLVVAHAAPPWLLERVLGAIGSGAQGYRPRVYAVHDGDPSLVLDALGVTRFSCVNLRLMTRAQLSTELESLWRWRLPNRAIGPVAARAALQPMIDKARAVQQRAADRLSAAVSEKRRARDRSFYGDRFTHAEGVRALLPVTRYSSYVRHAAEDLAGAIERAGDQARVLMEPAPDLRPSAAHELEAHLEFDPDVIIVPNWPRARRASATPGAVPFVCWVQDMLGHLFDPRIGTAQSELDFTAGLVNGALVRDFGYPLDRVTFQTTPACPVKFHNAAIDPQRAERFACDVAYVSHQSEPIDRFLDRLLARATSDAESRLVRAIAHEVTARIDAIDRPSVWDFTYQAFEDLTRAGISETLGESHAGGMQVAHTLSQLTMPIAERVFRHTMLRWAHEACEQCGLRLAIYGKGWERTEFAEFARGDVDHAEDLRACYASARCHLHGSLSSNAHQRVFECALAGGLMLRRGPSPDAPTILQGVRQRLAEQPINIENDGRRGYRIAHESMLLEPHAHGHCVRRLDSVLERGRTGLFERNGVEYRAEWIDVDAERAHRAWAPSIPLEQFPDWSFDDAHESRFSTRDELHALIVRGVENDGWRTSQAAHHRARALAYNTTDAFWRRLRGFLTRSLST